MARKFATGYWAWGICQRCGQRDYLRNLVRDGQYPGILVHGECYEMKQPQENPVDVTDPTALRHPSPEVDKPGMQVQLPTTELWGAPLSYHQVAAFMGDVQGVIS